jgi:RNA polymerase sigma-70 factor (ECF subfamily)
MGATGEPTDDELLRKAGEGDAEAFGRLYQRRQSGIYRFAWRMTGSRSLAEDVTQETFMALLRQPEAYDPSRGSPAALLYGIARNHVLRHLQRTRPSLPLDDPDGELRGSLPEGLVSREGPDHLLARAEAVRDVRRAILALPPAFREVVVLCELVEVSYADAARALGCPVGTVRSRLHRARGILSEALRGGAEMEATPAAGRALP